MNRSSWRAERSWRTAIAEWRGGCSGEVSCVNRKRGVTGDARTRVASAFASSAGTTEERVGSRGSQRTESDLAVGYDQDLGGPCRRLGVPGVRDRLLHAEIVGWNRHCWTEDALVAVEQAVLERLPEGSREARLTLTTANGTQFTSSRFLETLRRLGITHRRRRTITRRHQLHRTVPSQLERRGSVDGGISGRGKIASLERSLDRGVQSRRPHRGVPNRTPHEAFLAFEVY